MGEPDNMAAGQDLAHRMLIEAISDHGPNVCMKPHHHNSLRRKDPIQSGCQESPVSVPQTYTRQTQILCFLEQLQFDNQDFLGL